MTAVLDAPTTDVRDTALDAAPAPTIDVAGDLDAELAQQRIGEQVAVMTGAPGISTVHCLTVRTEEEMLPTM